MEGIFGRFFYFFVRFRCFSCDERTTEWGLKNTTVSGPFIMTSGRQLSCTITAISELRPIVLCLTRST